MNEQHPDERAFLDLLPAGTRLRRRYLVESLIVRDAQGLTYAGYDERARQDVVIKEYLPRALARRALDLNAVSPKNKSCGELFFLGAEAFLSQHHALTEAVGSPNVLSVFDAFFENGTAYAVVERLEGVTLERYLALKRRPLSAGEAMYVAASMADALLVVDSLGMLHHDVCARSLFFCTDGTVKLVEFAAARAILRAHRAAEDAPPRADLFSLAETLYAAMTGRDARDGVVPNERVPAPLMALFLRMLEPDVARRVASVFDYRHALACVEIEAECPEVSIEEGGIEEYPLPSRHAAAPRTESKQDARRPDPELEDMSRAAARESLKQGERRVKRIALLCGGAVLVALILGLILRAALRQ